MAAGQGAIEERRFVTMRFKRIKTWGHVYHVRRHNTREMECRHVEKDAPPPQMLVGDDDVAGAIRSVLADYGVKPRDGEVLALEFIVSASREVFEGIDRDEYNSRINNMILATMRALRARFQIPDQIVSVALHKDERTPHLHVVVVPLIKEADGRRKDKTPFVRLSAKRVIGGRGDMSREQTRFASYFAQFGLERGKERSHARHVPNREHEAMLEAARREAIEMRDSLDAARAKLETERAALNAERARLEADRQRVLMVEEEAAALKARASDRAKVLREMLRLADQLGQDVLAAQSPSPAVERMKQSSTRMEAARREALARAQNDEWLAGALAYRSGKTGSSR